MGEHLPRLQPLFLWPFADSPQSKRFFSLPHNVKQMIAHPPSGEVDDHRGFAEVGLGLVSQMIFDRDEVNELRKTAPEKKETLEMGNSHDVGDDVPPNRWLPEDVLPGFRSFFESWWDECARLEHSLLRSMCEALHIADHQLLSKSQKRDVCHMSLAHYPAMPLAPLQNRELRRCNAHTDFGQLTLVFQDLVGGLEVHDGQVFRPVVPKPGTVVVNVGDMLEMQTNGRFKSALHQVVGNSELMQAPNTSQANDAQTVRDRYSLVFFGAPDPESWVETLPGCEKRGKWHPNMIEECGERMTAGDWIQKRVAVEY
jgi:isopenicillin N synthase-like dioxygenase